MLRIIASRRGVAVFLIALIAFLNSPLQVFAAETESSQPQFLASDILTSEIEKLGEVKPELTENFADTRKEKIQTASSDAEKWTERLVLGKLENGATIGDVVGKRKDAEKVVADLKQSGAITTLSDTATGAETEIDPTLKKSASDILATTATPYSAEISTISNEPLVLSENSAAAGDVVSAVSNDQQVAADATPETREEVRYFNWNANQVDGTHEDNKILYPDLWDSTDLLMTAGETGMKEDLILKNALAPTSFNYIVETVGLKLKTTDDGGYVFTDELGNEKFYTPAPNLTDAKGQFVKDALHFELGWPEKVAPDSTAATVAAPDPILSEIKFDQESNEKFLDEKSDQVGTIAGGQWLADGIWGGALALDAADGSAKIVRDFATPATTTLSAWVKAGAYQNGQIVGFGNNAFRQVENKGFEVTFRLGDKNFFVDWDNSTLVLGQWYHLVATFDGAKIHFYVDGEEKNSLEVANANALTPTADPIQFGGNFTGAVDEFEIFDHALSAEEVKNLHQQYLDQKIISQKTFPAEEEEIQIIEENQIPDEIEVIDESELKKQTVEQNVVEEGNLDETKSIESAPTEQIDQTEATAPEVVDPAATEKQAVEPTEQTETVAPTEEAAPTEQTEPTTPTKSVEENTQTEEVAPTAVDQNSATEKTEPTPAEEVPAVESNATSFFDTLKKFFAPIAFAEIQQFDDQVSIENIIDSNDTIETNRDAVIPTEEAVPTDTVENSEPLSPENVEPEQPETTAPEVVDTTATEKQAVEPTEQNETVAPTEEATPTEEVVPVESTDPEQTEQPDSTDITAPEEVQIVEEAAPTETEINVIEEKDIEQFFSPETTPVEPIVKIAPDADIVVVTEQEVFAESNKIFEEIPRADGAIVRRYKLRLVIDAVASAKPAEVVVAPSSPVSTSDMTESEPENVEPEQTDTTEPETTEEQVNEQTETTDTVEPSEQVEPTDSTESVDQTEQVESTQINTEQNSETPATEPASTEEGQTIAPTVTEENSDSEVQVIDENQPQVEPILPTENSTKPTENSTDSEAKVESVPADSTEKSDNVQAENLTADVLATETKFATAQSTADLPKTLLLENGLELTYPIDIDPSTFVTLVNRGARTFDPNFADGVATGEYSQTNVSGSINRGTEAASAAQVALGTLPENLQQGLVGYWKMDDDWIDSSDNSNDGTASGGATFDTSGKFNSAGSFDGVDDYIDAGTNISDLTFQRAVPFSVSAWIKPSAGIVNYAAIIQNLDGASYDGFNFFIYSNSGLGFRLGSSGADKYLVYASSGLTLSSWNYVTATYDGSGDASGIHIFINGVSQTLSVGDNDCGTTIDYSAAKTQIGRYAASTYFKGQIDDLAVLNRALSASEIAAIYAGGRINAVDSKVFAVDSTGTEFSATALTNSQDWSSANDILETNSVGAKIKFTTEITASEIWAGLDFSPAGGVVRATIDKGTDQEISTEIDTYSSSLQTAQKVLLATGLRNSTHSIELELLPQSNPRHDSADANSRFALEYFETRASGAETSGASIASTADSGSTTTLTDAALTQSDDYWKGYSLEFTSGANNGQTVFVTGFDAATDTLIFTPAVDTAVSDETFKLAPDGILINSRATRGLNFNSTNAQRATFENLDNFPTEADGTVKKGTISIWTAPDFDSDADTAKHFVFDNGIVRIYYDGADDKFKFEMWDGDDWSTVDVASAAQSFSADDTIHLVASWDNLTGIKLFVGGIKTAKSVAWTAQNISTADTKISFGRCGTRSGTVLTASQTYFGGVLAEPQIWNYVLLDSEIFGIFNSTIPSVGQSHAQKIEANSTENTALLFNAPLVNSSNDRIGSLAGAAKLDSKIVGEAATISATNGQEPNWISDGRVAYWKMDNNWKDSSGSNDGTANGGVNFASGKFGSAGSFDGTDDYVGVADDNSLKGMSAISVSFWVNPSESQTTGIVDKNRYSEWNVHLLSNQVRFEGKNVNSDSIRFTSNSTVNLNRWTFVTVVYENNTKKIYFDGVEQSITIDDNGTGAIYASTNPIYIGRVHDGHYFKGSLDDVAIYNRSLSAAEIAQLYQKDALKFTGDPLAQFGGVLNSDSLVGFWKMDGDFTDSFGSLDTTANGGATTATGRFGSAANLDGLDDYLDIGDTSQNINSISFWILPENASRDVIDLDGGSHYISLSSGTISATGFTAPKIFVDGYETTKVSNNVWHHIAITTSTAIDANAFKIGKKTTFFDGKLDEVALFSRQLSASEIATIYAADANNFANYTTPDATTELVGGFDTGPDRGIAKITLDAGTPNEIRTEVDTYAATTATNQRFLLATNLDAKAHTVKIENTNVKNLSATAAIVVPKFIETNSSSTVVTNSLAPNARLVDQTIVPDYDDFPNGLVFPAKGNISQIQNTGTLEFWATGALASGDHFFDTRDASGHDGARLYMNSANSLTFEFQNASSSVSIVDADFASAYSSSAANHILASWWRPTATTFGLSLYLNGQKVAENISQDFTPSTHSQIVIGNDSTPDTTADFDGAMSDFAIYSAALDDGGVALGSFAIPNSQVWKAYNSRAIETQNFASLQIDSDTTLNATDGVNKNFYLSRGAVGQKIITAKNYEPQNRDTAIELRLGATDNVALAQQFTVDSAGTIPAISLWLKKVGTPTGNLSLSIETDASDLPSGTTITDGAATTVAVDSLSSDDFEWVNFQFATPPTLSANTKYHLVLEGDFAASATNNLVWAADTSTPSFVDGTSEIKDSAWTESSEDFIFRIFENRTLANSVSAFVNGRGVTVASANAGSFARINFADGISPIDTSFTADSIVDASAIPSSGFLWLGNPGSQFKREKVYYGSYSAGTFSDLKRGVDGTTAGAWGDNTIVEVVGAITLASAPDIDSDLFVQYEFSGDVVDRDHATSNTEHETLFLDETEGSSTGWAKSGTDSDKITTVGGQTVLAKLRGTEISAVLDFVATSGGVSQFTLDEGTRNEKRILVDSGDTTALEKIKSLATNFADGLHSLRVVANIFAGETHFSALIANGHAPILVPAASSEVEYAEPLADLNPEETPENYINLENAIGGNDAHTKLLIHSDTTDGSTTFEDSSKSGHAITAVGGFYHSTTTQKFGTSAIQFDGVDDYLSVADSDDWNFADQDFTIDLWARFNNIDQNYALMGQKTDNDNRWDLNVDFGSSRGAYFTMGAGASIVTISQGSNSGWAANT
ncbi:MAG: LamG-like jellyroll fold domain-containing protein, partial [Patescibacteria group bacterium]